MPNAQLFIINEGINVIRFDDHELALLAQTKNIRHLSIIGTVEDDVLLRQTLALWPVTRLTVEFSGYYLITQPDAPGLELEAFQALDEPPLEFFDHLVRSPTVTIRCLRVHTVSDMDVLVRPFAHTVREIFLGFPETDDAMPDSGAPPPAAACEEPTKWTWPCADVLAECKELARFGIGAPATRAMLDALPPGVQTFGLSPHTCTPADVQLVMDFLVKRPNVRTVELQVYRNSMHLYAQTMRTAEPLRAFCRSRGISVVQREMEYCVRVSRLGRPGTLTRSTAVPERVLISAEAPRLCHAPLDCSLWVTRCPGTRLHAWTERTLTYCPTSRRSCTWCFPIEFRFHLHSTHAS